MSTISDLLSKQYDRLNTLSTENNNAQEALDSALALKELSQTEIFTLVQAAMAAANDAQVAESNINNVVRATAKDILQEEGNDLIQQTTSLVNQDVRVLAEEVRQLYTLISSRGDQVGVDTQSVTDALTQVLNSAQTVQSQVDNINDAIANAAADLLTGQTQALVEQAVSGTLSSLTTIGKLVTDNTGPLQPWDHYLADTRDTEVTRALPTQNIPANTQITVRDRWGNASDNPITLTGPVDEQVSLILQKDYAWVTLQWLALEKQWIVISGAG